MLLVAPRFFLLVLTQLIPSAHFATIGDGRTSLISGKPVDYRSGSCNIDGRSYASETSVPREDPCHYCICFRGKIDCYWKKCANVPQGCYVMDVHNTCNPSLYICDIPEKARDAPVYAPPSLLAGKPTSPPQSPFGSPQTIVTAARSFARPSTVTAATAIQFSIRPARQPVIPPSRELTPPERQQLIEPPSRHLTPPLKQPSIQSRQLSDDRQPSQFGLRMKQKMRFKRSANYAGRLPHNIQEDFPFDLGEEEVVQLVDAHIRSRRSINGSGSDNHHHHHHDHHHEEDRGCYILGVRYGLGEVVGVATDVCHECRCAAQSLFCSPKCCFKPAPFQLIGNRILEQIVVDPSEPRSKHPLHNIQNQFSPSE